MHYGGFALGLAKLALVLVAVVLPLPQEALCRDVREVTTRVDVNRMRAHVLALEGERFHREQRLRAAAYIAGHLESYGYEVVSKPAEKSDSLVVQRIGTVSPERVFVVGAHYDSAEGSPGADDNAVAVAGLLEVARLVADWEPEESLEIVFFADEEYSIEGSRLLVGDWRSQSRDVVGAVIMDMIGYTCFEPGCQWVLRNLPDCFEVSHQGRDTGEFIAALANGWSRPLIEDFVRAASTYVPDLPTGWAVVAGQGSCVRDTQRSDHYRFWEAGYAAMLITDTSYYRNPNYHRAGDTSSTLDLPFAADVIRAVLGMALESVSVASAPPTRSLPVVATPTPPVAPARSLLYGTRGNLLYAVDIQRGGDVAVVRLPGNINDFVMSPDGTQVFVIGVQSPGPGGVEPRGYLAVVDTARHAVVSVLSGLDELTGIAVDPLTNELLITLEREAQLTGFLQRRSAIPPFDLLRELGLATFIASSPTVDARAREVYVVYGFPAYDVGVISLDTFQVVRTLSVESELDPTISLNVSPTDSLAFFKESVRGRVHVFERGSDIPLLSWVADFGWRGMEVSGDGRIGVTLGSTTGPLDLGRTPHAVISVFDLITMRRVKAIEVDGGVSSEGYAMMPDASKLFLLHREGDIRVLDLKEFSLKRFRSVGLRHLAAAVVPAVLPTYTPTISPMQTATPTRTLSPQPTLTPICPGDCSGDRVVTIEEMVVAVGMALGEVEVDRCPAVDRNGDRLVVVDELVRSMHSMLHGCDEEAASRGGMMKVVGSWLLGALSRCG